jgi:hypothetical protein
MLKRIAAILFIFVVAGQVSAGVCGCFGEGSNLRHSCCKREKAGIDSMRPTTCCDSECAMQPSERVLQDRTEPAAKVTFETVTSSSAIQHLSFRPIAALKPFDFAPFANHRLKYSRPPELYLRHHAFLI